MPSGSPLQKGVYENVTSLDFLGYLLGIVPCRDHPGHFIAQILKDSSHVLIQCGLVFTDQDSCRVIGLLCRGGLRVPRRNLLKKNCSLRTHFTNFRITEPPGRVKNSFRVETNRIGQSAGIGLGNKAGRHYALAHTTEWVCAATLRL